MNRKEISYSIGKTVDSCCYLLSLSYSAMLFWFASFAEAVNYAIVNLVAEEERKSNHLLVFFLQSVLLVLHVLTKFVHLLFMFFTHVFLLLFPFLTQVKPLLRFLLKQEADKMTTTRSFVPLLFGSTVVEYRTFLEYFSPHPFPLDEM